MDALVSVTRLKEESGNSVCATCIQGPWAIQGRHVTLLLRHLRRFKSSAQEGPNWHLSVSGLIWASYVGGGVPRGTNSARHSYRWNCTSIVVFVCSGRTWRCADENLEVWGTLGSAPVWKYEVACESGVKLRSNLVLIHTNPRRDIKGLLSLLPVLFRRCKRCS